MTQARSPLLGRRLASAGAALVLALALMPAACGPAAEPSAAAPARAPAPMRQALGFALPVEFVAGQRTTTDIHGTGGALRVSLGDITAGKVLVTVFTPADLEPMAARWLIPGDSLSFWYRETGLELTLRELNTRVIGEDKATLVLAEGKPAEPAPSGEGAAPAAMDPMQRVDALLAALGRQSSAVFIRNGKEYDAADAADHLRRKLDAQRDEIHGVDDFIRLCGTSSSMSGEPYRVRRADGQEVPCADFLHELDRGLDAH